MNQTNRLIIAGSLVSGFYAMTYAATIDELKRSITSSHTRAFAQDNLYTTKIAQVDLKPWINTIDAVHVFVNKNNTFPQDKALTKAMTGLENASNDLINGLQITYNTIFSGTTKTVALNEAGRQTRKNDFNALAARIQLIETNLKREKYILPSKKDAQTLLLFLCPYMQTTAIKARTDIDKEVDIRTKK